VAGEVAGAVTAAVAEAPDDAGAVDDAALWDEAALWDGVEL
jgi:hypothetical protein